MGTLAKRVDDVNTDRFLYTLEALVYTILLALQLPLFLGYIAWLIVNSEEAPEFTKAIGYGLSHVVIVLAVLLFLFSLSRKGGIAGKHFKWSEATKSVLRRNMLWITAIVVPLAIIIRMVEAQKEIAFRGSLGRIVLLIGLVALAVF